MNGLEIESVASFTQMKNKFKTCLALLVSLSTTAVHAQQSARNCSTDAMLVFDGSGSMAETGYNGLDEPRIIAAREAMRRALPNITPFRNLGLLTYGAGDVSIDHGCQNVNLKFAPASNTANKITAELDTLIPNGDTPLTNSVEMAANVLDYKNKPGVVVLVTDGKETCGGEPCQLAAKFSKEGFDFKVHVVGFQIRSDFFDWRNVGGRQYENVLIVSTCLADQTGGKYIQTETIEELVSAMQETLGCALIGDNSYVNRGLIEPG